MYNIDIIKYGKYIKKWCRYHWKNELLKSAVLKYILII